jgi:hypothetical protein
VLYGLSLVPTLTTAFFYVQCPVGSCPFHKGLGCGFGTPDHPVFLCQECHSDSDFFLIFFQDCVQERKEVLNFLSAFLCGYIRAESPHEIAVIHKGSERDFPTLGGQVEYRRFPMMSVAVQMRTMGGVSGFRGRAVRTVGTSAP